MRFLEFTKAAEVVVGFVLGVQPGEDVLVVRDTRVAEFPGADALVEAIASAVHTRGAEPQVVNYVSRPIAGMEPPKVVSAAMKSADAVVIVSTLSILQTIAATEALAAGARVVMLPPARYIYNSLDLLYRLMPTDSGQLKSMMDLAEALADVFRKGKQVRLSSSKGTDVTLGIGQLKGFYNPSTARTPGAVTIIPGGQAGRGVNPGEAEGRLVIDGSASPMYRPLRDPIEMIVKGGKVIEVVGGSDAQEYRSFLADLDDPQVYLVAEVGVGINPHARLSGTPLEDERILGASWVAVGTNFHIGGAVKAKIHSDCVMLPPLTLSVDDRVVLKDRQFSVS